MRIQIFTLCDFAQSNAGKLSIIGTFNRIYANSFPFVYNASIFVVAKVCSNEAHSGSFLFSVTSPDGSNLMHPLTGQFNIKNPDNDNKEKSFDFCLNINNQVFNIPGTYIFKFETDGLVATQELYLSLRQ